VNTATVNDLKNKFIATFKKLTGCYSGDLVVRAPTATLSAKTDPKTVDPTKFEQVLDATATLVKPSIAGAKGKYEVYVGLRVRFEVSFFVLLVTVSLKVLTMARQVNALSPPNWPQATQWAKFSGGYASSGSSRSLEENLRNANMNRDHHCCVITEAPIITGAIHLDLAYIVPRKVDEDQLKAACAEAGLKFEHAKAHLASAQNGWMIVSGLHPAWDRGAFYVDSKMNLKARASNFKKYERELSFHGNEFSVPPSPAYLLFTESSQASLYLLI